MTENPYASLEQAIAAAVGELRSLRDQRSALQARVDQLERRLAAQAGETAPPTPGEPETDRRAASLGTSSERLQQLEIEREAIKTRLLTLQTRLGYLGSAEPEERHDDHR